MTEPTIDPLAACIDAIYGVSKTPAVAFIDEATCIGCTLCIQACPVDAIVGAARQMHTVVAAWCTGCELCLPPCPVDCIRMSPLSTSPADLQAAVELARQRYHSQLLRRGRQHAERAAHLAAKTAARQQAEAAQTRRALIDAALSRARKLNARSGEKTE